MFKKLKFCEEYETLSPDVYCIIFIDSGRRYVHLIFTLSPIYLREPDWLENFKTNVGFSKFTLLFE